jgi:hypothetical protein
VEDDFLSIVASKKQNAGPDRPGQPFDQIAVSDFLLILQNAVTEGFARVIPTLRTDLLNTTNLSS